MKISVNDEHLFTLSDTQKKVIEDQLHNEILDESLRRRLQWSLIHKYEQCFKRLKQEWDPKLLAAGIRMIPTDPDEYAQLVFSQPDYKSKAAQQAESLNSTGFDMQSLDS